jgi:hypothetical protein
MKKFLYSISVMLLIFGFAAATQAGMCTPDNPGSVDVMLTVSPTDACPGAVLTISGTITNTGDCEESYVVRLKFKYFYEYQSDWIGYFPGNAWFAPLTPKFLVPIVAGESFDFNYSAPLPEIIPQVGYAIPPGNYSLTIEARGTRGGAVSQDTAQFTVCAFARGEIFVGFHDHVTREEAESIVLSYGSEVKKDFFNSIGAFLVSVPEREELNYVSIFSAEPDVRYAEPNYYVYPWF